MIGIFLPTRFEYDAMDKEHLKSLEAIPILSGIGKINTVYSLAANIMRFNAFILCGFAGGYQGLSVGGIVEPYCAFQGDYDSEGLDDGAESIKNNGIDIERALYAYFYSQDHMIKGNTLKVDSDQKRIAVDMETYPFLAFMKKSGIKKYGVIRVISDLCYYNAKEEFINASKNLVGTLRTAAEMAITTMNKTVFP